MRELNADELAKSDTTIETARELNPDELESVSGGAQYPTGWPDGLPLPRP